ncbi:hypothetical protein SFRURICE_004245, partial [Spodoptera frugiperda]
MTVTLELNMRLISSLSSNTSWRRISIHGLLRLYKQGTLCKNQPALGSGSHVVGPPCQYNTWEPRHPTIAAQRNRPCIEILHQNIFEDNDEIRRIFSSRVTVIEIKKRVRACIRRSE